ncbi:class I SAM-dependent methyltransferase [Pontibacter sp. E15-1]|uniref:methyltransferase domain-containing protein n=1 Tax=Pontibacter sp. E15-1 TaxID=2919918 RepID=UPI001F4F3D5C|nr:methyltransferase domain-containing protein [Pontibacter sp. E15-1]MCJ8166422.1 class I SAM-dependent methyltransferase [Pontibacter sp. E15-1]
MKHQLKEGLKASLGKLGYSFVKTDNKHQEEEDLAIYRKNYLPDSLEHKRFYNVGSGDFYHPYWSNLDYVSDWYKDVQKNVIHIDLMEKKPLPIASNSAEVFYTSHTIEHIKDDAVQVLFNEAYRALKKGGYFRVTTGPDADSDFDALMRNDEDWFFWNKWYEKPGSYEQNYYKPATSVPLEERWLHHVASQLAPNDKSPSAHKIDAKQIRDILNTKTKEEALNYFTSLCEFQSDRPGNHVSWWNRTKISSYLEKAGFSQVYVSGYGQSYCPILRNTKFFDNTHPQISVYVEARK